MLHAAGISYALLYRANVCIYLLQEEADVGVIERIQLTDFMCHRKLDVPLSPNVNFILGRNGSEWFLVLQIILS